MVKRKPKNKSTFLKDPLNSIAVHVGNIVDKLTVRDIIYAATFGFGAYSIYQLLPKSVWVIKNNTTGEEKILPLSWSGYAPWGWTGSVRDKTEMGIVPVFEIGESLLAAYMLMKTDISDVTAAFNSIKGIVGKVVT